MGNVHVVQKLQTSMLIQMVNLDTTTYDYKFEIEDDDATLQYIYRGSSNNNLTNLVNLFKPNNGYLIFLYRTAKGGNSWGTYIDFTTTTTLARTEPVDANYFATYLPNIQNQSVYENGVYKGEANSCVANCLSLSMDILSYRNRAGNPQNNYFSPSYIYGNRTRQTSLTDELDGMFCNKTMEQLNIDGVPIWDNIPDNDNGFKTFPDNRALTTGYNYGVGVTGLGAKPMFDNRSTTLDYQAKVNRMSFPISYSYDLSGTLYNGDPYSFTSVQDFAPFFDGVEIANRIQTYGYCAMSFHIADNFYYVPSSGIVPQPDFQADVAHCSVLIGWITISGTKYWIGQNSWGTSWGDNGIFFIPMSYGATGTPVTLTVDFGYGDVNWVNNWVFDMNVASHVAPSLPSTPSAPVGDTIPRIDAGLNITWNPANNCDTYDIRYVEGSNTYYEYGVNRNTLTLSSLLYGTTYTLSSRGVNYLGTSSWSSGNNLTTSPKTPTITSSSLDAPNNQVSITIGGMTGNYTFFRIWYRNITDGGSWAYQQESAVGSYWITGLTLDKEYEFKVSSFITVSGTDIESRDSLGNIGYSSSVFYTISSRPDNWAWSYNIASGQDVYSVVNKTINIMPATEWNNFTSRINEFRVYKSLANYTFTSISSGNNVTKEIINEALTAIRAMSAHFTGGNTLISNRIAGENILEANIYINMRDCMNSIT